MNNKNNKLGEVISIFSLTHKMVAIALVFAMVLSACVIPEGVMAASAEAAAEMQAAEQAAETERQAEELQNAQAQLEADADESLAIKRALNAPLPGEPGASADAVENRIAIYGSNLVGGTLYVRDLGMNLPLSPANYEYQWIRDSAAIPDATDETYTLVDADWNTDITLLVVAKDGTGYTDSVISNKVQVLKYLTGTITLPEGKMVGEALSITGTGLLATANTTYHTFKWFRDGEQIPGATAATYTPTVDDINKYISVEMTGVAKSGTTKRGYAGTLESNGVLIKNKVMGTLSLTAGNAAPGSLISITSNNALDYQVLNTNNYTFTWYKNDVAIAGETGASYIIREGDGGANFRVTVTGKASAGYTGTVQTGNKGLIVLYSEFAVGSNYVEMPTTLSTYPTAPGTYFDAYQGTGAKSWTVDGVAEANDNSYNRKTQKTTAGVHTYSFRITLKTTYQASYIGKYVEKTIQLPQNTITPTITLTYNKLTPGGVITATNNQASNVNAKWEYEWVNASGASLGATGLTYVIKARDIGVGIGLRVKQVGTYYQPVTVTSAMVTPVQSGTVTGTGVIALGTNANAVYVTSISGLTPSGFNWSALDAQPNRSDWSYQWYRDGAMLDGATNWTLPITPSDYGHVYKVVASVKSSSGYTSPAIESEIVASSNGTTTGLLTIYGSNVIGGTLHARDLGLTLPLGSANYGYQWYRGVNAIPEAEGETYTLTDTDWNEDITLTITPKAETGYVDSITSNSIHALKSVTGSISLPEGIKAGAALNITGTGLVTGVSTTYYTFKWFRDGVAIPGATNYTYTPTAADINKRVSVEMTGIAKSGATKRGYAGTLTSNAVLITYELAGTLTLTAGNAAPGGVIGVTSNNALDLEVLNKDNFTFEWQRNNVAIPGATDATYVITAADGGQPMNVVVRGRESRGFKGQKASANKTLLKLTRTTAEVVSGKITMTFDATAANSVPLPVNWNLQTRSEWYIDGAKQSDYPVDANAQSITLLDTSVHTYTFRAKYLDTTSYLGDYIDFSWTGNATSDTLIKTAKVNVSSATLTPGSVLTAVNTFDTTYPNDDKDVWTYQWYKNNVAISGETATTYTVRAGDVGAQIKCQMKQVGTYYSTFTTESAYVVIQALGSALSGTGVITLDTDGQSVYVTSISGYTPTIFNWNALTSAPDTTLWAYQWYRDGVLLEGETGWLTEVTSNDYGHLYTVVASVRETSGYT
ncbi:MAG: hypothetical protein LBM38_00755, partial [Clostridiales bacterium]|nr:hypothetical protein [Clostridiales bacterium]